MYAGKFTFHSEAIQNAANLNPSNLTRSPQRVTYIIISIDVGVSDVCVQ